LQLEVWEADTARLKGGPKPEKGEGRRVREIWNKKTNGDEFQKKLEEKMEKLEAKFAEFQGRIPETSSNGGFRGNYRQSGSSRHTAQNSYGGTQPPQNGRFPLNSRGPNPGSYSMYLSNFARPPMNYRVNGNFYQPLNSTVGCFKCGDPSHRMRECPGYSAEQWQRVLQQQPSQQPAPVQQQPDVRPVKDRSEKKDKTCIWVKYRQHKISTLIDTGSDVSIAGEDVARKMGWTVQKHRTKEVCVANNEVMTVRGAAYVILAVAGRGTESEILIAPDLDGLILGIDWLWCQGRVRWDFEHGRVRFGDREWANSKNKLNIVAETALTNWIKQSPDKCWKNTFDKQVTYQLDRTEGHADVETFDLNTKKCLKEEVGESNLQTTTEVSTLSCCNSTGDVIADNLNTMMVEIPDETMSSSQPHSTCVSKKFGEESNFKKFCEKSNPLSSSIRLWESREVCCVPTLRAQSLLEQEVTGNRTVIIIEGIKEVKKCEKCECRCFGKEGRQKPRVAQNVNFPCIRCRVMAAEGEGHQKQEAQSVNPSIGSIKANYFGEEGHQQQEAPSVNFPVKCEVSNKMCVSSTLFPVCRYWSRAARGNT